MAYRQFDGIEVSRRSLLRGGMWLGAGALAATMPMGRLALAQASAWPNVSGAVTDYVASGKVANMLSILGWGQKAPDVIAAGTLAKGAGAVVDADSLFRIYSMTKPVTGIAAMICIEDGKLGLDTPVAEVLPAFAEMRVLRAADGPLDDTVPAERPITIRQLMTHTAGLGYEIIAKGPLREAFFAKGVVSGQVSKLSMPGMPSYTPAPGLETWADRLATLPLIAQPGTRWSYSCSLDLLGRVIEVVSGQSFDVFLKERLFDPCGMSSTWFRVPQSEVGRLTTNYAVVGGSLFPVDPAEGSIFTEGPPVLWGGSGLVCSPRDYDRFLQMLVGYGKIEGKRVMGELAVRVGTSNFMPSTVDTSGTWVAGQGFGAGGRVSGDAFGWAGAAGTTGFAEMEKGLRASNFTQYLPSEAYPIQREFPDLVLKDLAAMAG